MRRREQLESKFEGFCIASEMKNAREDLKRRLIYLRMWRARSYFSTGNPKLDYYSMPILYVA